jgi:hypothetical protein
VTRHGQRVLARRRGDDMILSTMNDLPGYEITEVRPADSYR